MNTLFDQIFRVGFTGTQKGMTPNQSVGIMRILCEFTKDYDPFGTNPCLEFHHGDCIGGDEEAACHADGVCFTVVGHPPLNESKRAFWKSHREEPAKEYLDRDHDIVHITDLMLAAPKSFKEELRSGTWATIRYTRKIKKHLKIVWPDGSITEENKA